MGKWWLHGIWRKIIGKSWYNDGFPWDLEWDDTRNGERLHNYMENEHLLREHPQLAMFNSYVKFPDDTFIVLILIGFHHDESHLLLDRTKTDALVKL